MTDTELCAYCNAEIGGSKTITLDMWDSTGNLFEKQICRNCCSRIWDLLRKHMQKKSAAAKCAGCGHPESVHTGMGDGGGHSECRAVWISEDDDLGGGVHTAGYCSCKKFKKKSGAGA